MIEWISGQVRRARSARLVNFLEAAFAPTWRRDMLAIVVLVGLFVPTFFEARLNPGGTDDCAYFEYAAGQRAGAPHHQQRFALLGTVWLAQAIFGYTSWAYYAVPFVYSLGLVLVTYFAARALIGVALSLLAASMVLWLPVVLQQGTWLLPDIPGVFWIVLGVGIFMRALKSDTERLPWKRAIGSGVCFFLAVSTKESTAPVLFGLAAFPLALMSKRAVKVLLLTAAATATLALCELVVMWAVFDDALYRLHAVSDGHVPQMAKFVRTQADMPEHVTWGYLTTRFIESMANHRYGNGWPFLGLGYWDWLALSLPFAIVAIVLAKDRLLLGVIGFAFWAYLSLTFALSSFDPLIPMVRTRDRYFIIVLVWLPIVILAGWSRLWAWPFRRPPPRPWARLRLGSMIGASALYVIVSFGTGRFYLDAAPSIVNGNFHVATFYEPVRSILKTGVRVKRVVGPRQIRAAPFTWPPYDFHVVWRGDELETKKKLKPRDLLIAREAPGLQVPRGLVWQRVERHKSFRYYYLDAWKRRRPQGSYGFVAVEADAFKKRPTAALAVRLKLDTDDVTPRPVRVVLNRRRGPKTLETLDWEVSGDVYTLQATTSPFTTSSVHSVSLEFNVKGTGRFSLRRPHIRVLDPEKKK